MCEKPKHKVNTFTVWVVARNEEEDETRWLAAGSVEDPCTPPRGEHRSTIAVAEVQMKKISKKLFEYRARKSATEGLIWPLCEGREICGADGAFASIRMVI